MIERDYSTDDRPTLADAAPKAEGKLATRQGARRRSLTRNIRLVSLNPNPKLQTLQFI